MPTVADAREQYFRANGFSTATYSDRWVKLKIGPIPIAFPNTESRRAAIPLHDLHHVATGYATTIIGEAEIAAWELAGGCGRYAAAWLLNLSAVLLGFPLSPRRVVRAFRRGRRCTPLYRQRVVVGELLALDVGELRAMVGC